jgi:hypothetical protein
MSRWKTAQHFTSWLALAPHNKISGGRLLSSKTAPSANRAAVVLRRCAMSRSRTSTALGAFYRRRAARVGKAKAIPPPPASSPCWSIVRCAAASFTKTPAPSAIISSIVPARLSPSANAPNSSALNSLTLPLVKCLILFLRSQVDELMAYLIFSAYCIKRPNQRRRYE